MKKNANIAIMSAEFLSAYKTAFDQHMLMIDSLIDHNRFDVYKIHINNTEWIYKNSFGDSFNIDKNDFSLNIHGEKTRFSLVFLVAVGQFGDGILQSYLEMINIPYIGYGRPTAAIFDNKWISTKFVSKFGIMNVPKTVPVFKNRPFDNKFFLDTMKFPLFVKPARQDNSIGISKINSMTELIPAIEKAWKYCLDRTALVQESIHGRELSCGVYKLNGVISALPITEIITSHEFLDFEAKYGHCQSEHFTPAKLTEETTARVHRCLIELYEEFDLRDFVRFDLFLQEETEKLYFLEVNICPNHRDDGILMKQIRAANLSIHEIYAQLIEERMENTKN